MDVAHGSPFRADDEVRDGVLDIAPNDVSKVARAADRTVHSLAQSGRQSLVVREEDALVLQGVDELADHEDGDVLVILVGEVVEEYDFVDTADELGTEELAQRLHGVVAVLFRLAGAEAGWRS